MITIFDETVRMDYRSKAEFYVFKGRVFYHSGWVGGIPEEIDLKCIKRYIDSNIAQHTKRNLYRNILCVATSENAPEFEGWSGEASLEEQLGEMCRFAEYLGYKVEDRKERGVHFVKTTLTPKNFSSFNSPFPYHYCPPCWHLKKHESISLEDLVILYNTPHWQWNYVKEEYRKLKSKVRQFDKAFFKLHLKRCKGNRFMVSDTFIVKMRFDSAKVPDVA